MTVKNNKPVQTTCESCGKDFSCGARTESCWCFEIKLDADALKNFQKIYKNCLCPNCLKNKIDLLLPGQSPNENCG
jgi:ribosomal protein L34E